MIVQCPSCNNSGEFTKKLPARLKCNKCSFSFQVKSDSSPPSISERVWKVKGEKGPAVSLRVLKFRVKARSLSTESEISKDGKSWIKVSSHPALKDVLTNSNESPPPGRDRATVSIENSDRKVEADRNPQLPPQTENTAIGHKKMKWPASFGLASFAIVAAFVFFIPLSNNVEKLGSDSRNLKNENVRLRGVLTQADKKIGELEEKLLFISSEFDRVKSSSEEFKRTKNILEDIKKRIDSDRLYLVVSLAENKVYVKIGTKTLKSYVVSTGKGKKVLKGTGKSYNFLTPRGKRIIKAREKNPVWYKPNWVWLEQGLKLPADISIEDRAVKGELGKHRLKLGGGYSIHGTRSGVVKGKNVTHGCIRMGRQDIKALFAMVKKGTEVYIY